MVDLALTRGRSGRFGLCLDEGEVAAVQYLEKSAVGCFHPVAIP
jgi:hypothetical protein